MTPQDAILPTVPNFPAPAAPAAPEAVLPTHVAVEWQSGTAYSGEIGRVLLSRLRTVTVIAAVPLLIFLLRVVLDPLGPDRVGEIGLTLHVVVCLVQVALAVLLWARDAWTTLALRRVELAAFGSLTVFFCWLQFDLFSRPNLFHCAGVDPELELVRVWIDGSATRWFFLLVLYGVFIPNTWKRCAAVAASMWACPVLLTPAGAHWHGRLSADVFLGVFDLAVLVGVAFSIAVYGTYRIQTLRREAYQARRLGQYVLHEKIGGGGMGEVYKAEHVMLRRPCALKLVHPDRTRVGDSLARFEREVRAMAALTHPNTVEVYDYGRANDGTFYYVMEYLPGRDLDTLVEASGAMPAGRVVHFLRQVCGALREAHDAGLLHRDVKPGNVIACERGGIPDVAKLLDFGLVQETKEEGHRSGERLTVRGTILGSPPFMSPEQALGRDDLDARTDIYSLGGLGYFLATGSVPFPRDSPMEMLLAHAYEAPRPPSQLVASVPADLEAVLMRCLAKKPEDRYPDAASVDKALAACACAGDWTEDAARTWWAANAGGAN